MSEEEDIAQSPEDRKPGSQEQLNNGSSLSKDEHRNENIKPETENMEVFHKPDLHHGKKQWKEYFLEFLMIFLAVTLGFFAESLREYISDGRHVHQLASQLIRDLKNDSAILSNNIEKENLLVKKADSLFYLLQQPLSNLDLKKLQVLIITCYNINLFQPSSGAMWAVKTELHLKKFANSNMTLFISDYETDQALLKTVEQFQMANLKEYIQGFIIAHFTSSNAYSSLSYGTIATGDLRNISQNDLTQLSVDIMFVKNYNALLADKSSQLKEKGSEFIQYASKEFE